LSSRVVAVVVLETELLDMAVVVRAVSVPELDCRLQPELITP
jgi:hypothetical protein